MPNPKFQVGDVLVLKLEVLRKSPWRSRPITIKQIVDDKYEVTWNAGTKEDEPSSYSNYTLISSIEEEYRLLSINYNSIWSNINDYSSR
jgi:hypothetical protein